MYTDFSAKEIPANAIRALGSPPIQATQDEVNSHLAEWEDSASYYPQIKDPSLDTEMPQYDPNNPNNSNQTTPSVCDALVLCADGTTEEACGYRVTSLCTGHGGVYDPEVVYEPDVVESDNPCEGVMCIAVYKPCEEGYMDADPCCPHTGNCIPDPDYVAADIPVLPVGDTPSTQLDADVPTRGTSPNTGIVPPKHLGGAGGLVGGIGDTSTYRSDTSSSEFNYFDQQSDLLLTDTTDTADTTETPTEEKPKESGLGILAIGLIALKVLAT
jgi:hypothetical protein